MAAQESWQQLEGATIEGRVQLGRLLALDPSRSVAAVFAGAAQSRPVYVRFLPLHPSDGPVVERHLEAGFLDHPHLLKCYGAGPFEFDSAQFVYALVDPWEATLDDVLGPRALEPEGARILGLELLDALEFLHRRNLVYCNLSPSAVVRAGGRWKLADYSHMQVAGGGYAAETRRLLAIDPGTPPEAFEGIVSPAWDAWGLAVLLTTAISERPSADAPRASQELPEPFAALALECFQAAPQERGGLERIRELLQRPVTEAVPKPFTDPLPVPAPTALPATGPEPEREIFSEPVPEQRRFGRKTLAGLAVAALAGSLFMAAMIRGSSPHENASPAPAPPGQKPPPAPLNQAERAEVALNSDVTEITHLLDEWVAAIRERDVAALVSLYAPRLQRFYRATDVSRDFVRRERQRDLERAGTIRRYEISDVETRLQDPNEAVVTFSRIWDFARGPRRSGKTRTQLTLKKMGDSWRITGERDFL
jgi:hypothetical protein